MKIENFAVEKGDGKTPDFGYSIIIEGKNPNEKVIFSWVEGFITPSRTQVKNITLQKRINKPAGQEPEIKDLWVSK